MLVKLNIKNYALIEDIELDLDQGFSAITGETGAGKSIMLGALSLVLGDRADKSIFKSNDKKCVIEVHFNIEEKNLRSLFEKEDLDHDEVAIFRREISSNGKSRSFINDTPVTVSQLKLFANELIDVHSQHHSLKMNSGDNQLSFLDLYAGNTKLLDQYAALYLQWKKMKVKLQSLESKKIESLREYDLNNFQLNELVEADLDSHDHSLLEEKFEVSNNAHEIKEGISLVQENIDATSGAAYLLKKAKQKIDDLLSKNKNLIALSERTGSVIIELEDIDYELSKIADELEIDPKKLLQMEGKLNELNSLLFKHRIDDFEKLKEIKNDLENKVQLHQNIDPEIDECKKELDRSFEDLTKKAKELNKRRSEKAPLFASEIEKVISGLKMNDSRIQFQVEELDTYGEKGNNTIQFLISSDKGKSFLPMNKVASGGELSRVMLAVKSIISRKTSLPTIIFDEIDTGVSGEVARKTAEILRDMAANMQVISITHLPQVASLAEHHFLVFKDRSAKKHSSQIRLLNTSERVEEIAKMLSGEKVSKEALANAEVLLTQ